VSGHAELRRSLGRLLSIAPGRLRAWATVWWWATGSVGESLRLALHAYEARLAEEPADGA
jgi:hypothetical protein